MTTTPTRTAARTIARLALVAGCFAGASLTLTAAPAGAITDPGGVITIDPCFRHPETCVIPPIELPPVDADPDLPVDPGTPDPGDPGTDDVGDPDPGAPDPECTIPTDASTCDLDGDGQPGYPDSEGMPADDDAPVTATPTFTG